MATQTKQEYVHGKPSLPNVPKARWKEVAAGSVSGMCATFIGMPFDIMKVHFQSGKKTSSSAHSRSNRKNRRLPLRANHSAVVPLETKQASMVASVQRLYKRNGVSGFFKGALAPVVTRAPITGGAFGLQTAYTAALKNFTGSEQCTVMEVGVAGAFTGITLTPLIASSERVKVQLQMQALRSSVKVPIHGFSDCVRQLYRAGAEGRVVPGTQGAYGGFRSIFLGSSITALRLIPGWGIYFGTYEYLTRLTRKDAQLGANDTSSWQSKAMVLAAGGTAGMLTWMFSLPFDVVKTRIQNQPLHKPLKFTSWVTCARHIYNSGPKYGMPGWRMFFRGLTPALLRSFPVNAANFMIFEKVFQLLNTISDD